MTTRPSVAFGLLTYPAEVPFPLSALLDEITTAIDPTGDVIARTDLPEGRGGYLDFDGCRIAILLEVDAQTKKLMVTVASDDNDTFLAGRERSFLCGLLDQITGIYPTDERHLGDITDWEADRLIHGARECLAKRPTHPAMDADRVRRERLALVPITAIDPPIDDAGWRTEAGTLRRAIYPSEEELPQPKPSTPERLSVYGFGLTLMVISLPVGASAMTYALLGRENVTTVGRLLAVTATAIGLSQMGFVPAAVAEVL